MTEEETKPLFTTPGLALVVSQIATINPLTLDSSSKVKEAARGMERCGCGCCLVESNGKIIGIVTERDIVRRVAAKGLSLAKTSVKEIMSSPLIVIDPDASIETACKIMAKNGLRRLPVVGEKGLLGIITITDVARALAEKSSYTDILLNAIARKKNTEPSGIYG